MRVWKLFEEENAAIEERYKLSMERIAAMRREETTAEPYRSYFHSMAAFVGMIEELIGELQGGALEKASQERLEQWNRRLYEDVAGEAYGNSYANPAVAAERLGDAMGPMLSYLYTELRGDIVYAFEQRLVDITVGNELLIQIYNLFEEEEPAPEEVRQILYWWNSDYNDVFLTYRVREQLDPTLSFAQDIICGEDLSNPRYLYLFGEYITASETGTSQYLASLSQGEIDAMAATFTEGYRIGFEVAGKPLKKKKTVNIRWRLGFERLVRAAIKNFQAMGLAPVLYREPLHSLLRRPQSNPGYSSAGPNRQYWYDHKGDDALYLDKKLVERKLGVLRAAYEEYRELAATHAGPAVMEVFGEEEFVPHICPQALSPSEKQRQLQVQYSSESGRLVNAYIPGEERSFTIIAYPLPEIGPKYQEIFGETVKINTLDYKLYQQIQQCLIDALDQGVRVHIKGGNGNRTDLWVQLQELSEPEKETLFENCVADVNIPVGEVFTSPRLAGTNGLLHVSQVYLHDLNYVNLEIHLEDGRTKDYNCSNFSSEEENKAYIREHVLYHHESLPLGEFAIGTNTTAYVMARRYGIGDKLPILIAEKMGPHFALGDTCFSWEEDVPTWNPDGKQMMAKENECSRLRGEDPGKAYFNCHTDITIPYDELEYIRVQLRDGSEISIIEKGRFVLPGTEELNRPLEEFDLG
ncbi:MAG: aminopeptidase [Lachnospiraceae bacterium]|nr:aminopeptidase [Lachnospiraceae bacterium]